MSRLGRGITFEAPDAVHYAQGRPPAKVLLRHMMEGVFQSEGRNCVMWGGEERGHGNIRVARQGDLLAVVQVPVPLGCVEREVRLNEADGQEERLVLGRQRSERSAGGVRKGAVAINVVGDVRTLEGRAGTEIVYTGHVGGWS